MSGNPTLKIDVFLRISSDDWDAVGRLIDAHTAGLISLVELVFAWGKVTSKGKPLRLIRGERILPNSVIWTLEEENYGTTQPAGNDQEPPGQPQPGG